MLNSLQRPNVALDRMHISGLSFEDIDLIFDLKVNNPNSIKISLAGFDYDFFLNNNSFVKGQQDKGLSIEANGESIVQVPINLKFTDIYQTYNSLKNNDSTDYELKLGFAFDIPVLGNVRVPVSTKGMLPMVKFPSFSIQSLKLDRLSFNGADLKLQIAVDNPNAFALNLDKMDYQFAVNGNSWINGLSQNVTRLNQKGQGIIDIPISLDFLKVGQSVYQLLTGNNQLNYNFSGDFDVSTSITEFGTVKLPIEKTGQLNLTK
jgi:LEA14-like dessication related protein